MRGQLSEECIQHNDRLHVVPIHFRRHRGPTVQRKILLLHR